MDIKQLSAIEILQKIQCEKLSVTDVCLAFIKEIQQKNKDINAFITFDEESILKKAKSYDNKKEKAGKLFGLPIAVKDNFCVKASPTTAGSKMLENFIPPYTAHCIEELEREGAIIIGKTNMDEFAMGSSNENSFFGPCKNPWDTQRVPGGSSGGSAAAVAGCLAPVAIGSDTGGSIRQPASYCGVVGVKPTYGSISRFGLIAFASSLDQAGPLTQTVKDSSLILDIMMGKDPRDSTNVKRQQPSLMDLKKAKGGQLKIGLPKEFFNSPMEPGSLNLVNGLIKDLKTHGFEFVETQLSLTQFAIPVYYIVASSEASSNLSRFDGVRYGFRDPESAMASDLSGFYKKTRSSGFGREVKRRILLGTYSLSAGYYDEYYIQAAKVRRLMASEINQSFKECDIILTPTSLGTAFSLGEKSNDPVKMYFNDIFTVTANLCGLPAMSLPIGLDDKKMPVGIQLMAPAFSEKTMFEMALAIEDVVCFKGLSK